ncbi:2,3-dihydro-2,3-dihydroxybenzoate dehydrogenase [Planomonospora venezuelensis]|uniref:2,3-dihydro-2,3-dihydroxybenzoate dehydrogenase n=1 Tax=Planomonospora venezuelensis TaxID=1999 RepID=A0A841D3X7_PLAVE|nr:2,3-dihydro-2,3-dihydroxybenzoate dehydrogenase [Planomonospora venezuelensis]GIN03923.1 2,3-dihydro-2,3-dihydroxybenzoate dehydrogenase [Planomonospora venezuelensis]
MDGIGGRVALVTGAGQGIGAAVRDALTGAGARVAAADLRLGPPEGLAGAAPYPLDVRDPRAVEETVAAVERDLGPIDILVNVAGVLLPGQVGETGDEEWRQTFAVNADGVFHTCRAVADRMTPRRRGAIITVGSNAASVPRIGMAAYAASKAAAGMFTRCLGLELARYGIRCNVVSPGSTDTSMLRALWESQDPAGAHDATLDGDPAAFRVGIPLGRVADPRDIADAVLFLASDRARHITMHDLLVDGGATLRA